MVNKFMISTKKFAQNIHKKVLKQMLRHIKRRLEQTTDITELQETYQGIQDSFYAGYTRIKMIQPQQTAVIKPFSPYSEIRLNAIAAIKKIKPNLALTLNFNIKNLSTPYQSKHAVNKISNFIKECRKAYGRAFKAYYVIEHANSNIHAHFAIYMPRIMTPEKFFLTEKEMDCFWKMYIKSGTVYACQIYGDGWFGYITKELKNYSDLISV